MGGWQAVFGEIDDDYLAGISNKGIVKRAYKDRETVSCKIQNGTFSEGNEIAVTVGEETVHIRAPLGESTCSCPSRSICRHVILGILVLKEAVSKEAASKEAVSKEAVLKEAVSTETVQSAEESGESGVLSKVMQQITDYPPEKLCKKLGAAKLQEFIGCARTGRRPQIVYSSVVTVQPLAKAMTVKLLYPLEYSTCTCHKKEFCAHKAEAVLWCKLESGQISLDRLEQEQGQNADYDMGQMRDVARQMRVFLEELLDTGLSRTSQDVPDHMERLAAICHNARLPNFESDWRRLQDSYKKYLKRVASLTIQGLMGQITRLYRQVELLAQAQESLAVSKLAGAFRAEYSAALDLDLMGIAVEHFVSRSGYEGDTVYFLEENTKEWYTYTQARAVFYDNSTTAQRHGQEAPWGLPVSLKELAFWHIHLEQAKCDSRGRLSSSKETKGQTVGDRRDKNALTTSSLGKWYYQDFARLFEEQFRGDGSSGKLVFLRPASCGKAVFLETEQKLCMNLYDAAGKAVVVEVVYSRDEAEGIRYLEKITNENLPCFFGKVYLRDGRIRMYPVAVFGKKELINDGDA